MRRDAVGAKMEKICALLDHHVATPCARATCRAPRARKARGMPGAALFHVVPHVSELEGAEENHTHTHTHRERDTQTHTHTHTLTHSLT